jgi:hypothetical protein
LGAAIPYGHWKTTTFVAGLRLDRVVAPLVLDRPINAQTFEAYVEQFLAPTLRPGDIVIMDNLSSHKRPRVSALIEAVGAKLLYLPPTVPISIRSKSSSPSSRPCCERRPSEPSKAFGRPSANASTASLHANAQTTSPPPIRTSLNGKRSKLRTIARR